jgi:hypothetical protein
MNSQLARLISDYQASVRAAVAAMRRSGIPLPASNTDWAANGIPHLGALEDGIGYRKHGYGCTVDLPAGTVDFDFGKNGEICGFDPWRLAGFAGERLPEYGFSSERMLERCFETELAAGSLVHSGYLFYCAEDAARNVVQGQSRSALSDSESV